VSGSGEGELVRRPDFGLWYWRHSSACWLALAVVALVLAAVGFGMFVHSVYEAGVEAGRASSLTP
jgi:hypothetical protein